MKSRITTCQSLLSCLAISLSTLACLPASAGDQPVQQSPQAKVQWADLDLNTDQGRLVLLGRMKEAARRVCEQDAFWHGDVGYPMVFGTCYERTLTASVNKIHDRQLTALLASTTHPNQR
jgi:UrcA family protein